jgi:hypothetical protein
MGKSAGAVFTNVIVDIGIMDTRFPKKVMLAKWQELDSCDAGH